MHGSWPTYSLASFIGGKTAPLGARLVSNLSTKSEKTMSATTRHQVIFCGSHGGRMSTQHCPMSGQPRALYGYSEGQLSSGSHFGSVDGGI